MIDSFFLWLAMNFHDELYMSGLKVGALGCGLADIAATALFVRVMDVIHGRQPSKKTFAVLAVFAMLMPLHLLASNSTQFFIIMFFVFLPPYVILVWNGVTEAKHFAAHVKDKLRNH